MKRRDFVIFGIAASPMTVAAKLCQHEWYNYDNVHSKCYHCQTVAVGQYWPNGRDRHLVRDYERKHNRAHPENYGR